MSDKPKPSQPFDLPPDAPKDFNMHKALQGTRSEDGHWHVGKLEFKNRAEYLSFREAQNGLANDKLQLAVLYQLEVNGVNPGAAALRPAPPLVTTDDLLDLKGQKPDKAGYYHLGQLRVPEKEFAAFAAVQRDLCEKNPEAAAALYHMEHAKTQKTFRVTPDSDRDDRYESDSNTVYWNPHTAARDGRNGAVVDPATAALHEEIHLLLDEAKMGDILVNVPNDKMSNYNEGAVILGAEARDMDLRGNRNRVSHHGSPLNVKEIDDIKPSLTIRQDGVERDVSGAFKQSGKVVGLSKDGEWVTISTRGEGKEPAHRMDVRVDQIVGAFENDAHAARVLLSGALKNNDRISISQTADGRIVYDNPDQRERIAERDRNNDRIRGENHKHPELPPQPLGEQWPPYPRTMPQFDKNGDRVPEPVQAPQGHEQKHAVPAR